MNPPKCLLCGTVSQQHQLRSRRQSKMLAEWGRRLAVSLCQILDLDQTFEPIFSEASFCCQCQETVCNAEFTVSAISRLQCHLVFIKENIKGLLLTNYHGITAVPYPGVSSSAYNTTLERIVTGMGAVTKVEPSEDSEAMVTDSNEEFILPTLQPSSPPPPQLHSSPRLAALKNRQRVKIRVKTCPKSSIDKVTNSESLPLTKTENDIINSGELTVPLEGVTGYSRSGRKIKPSLKITEDIFEEPISSDDEGLDYDGGQDTPESESESEKIDKCEKPRSEVKKKRERKGRYVSARKPTDIKFTCNYESCTGEQLTFPRPHDVKVHLESVHGGEGLDTLYHCVHCPHRAKKMEKLRRHYLIHKEFRPRHPCPTCGKEFLSLYNRRKHEVNCLENKSLIKCKHCRKPFPSVEELSAHVVLHSATGRSFDCVLCDSKLQNRQQLRYHVRTIHEGIRRPMKYPEGLGPFPCNFPSCLQNETKIIEVLDMKRHLAEVHGQPELAQELIYHCIQCDGRFKLNRMLQRHVAETHELVREVTKDNLCSICGKVFHSAPTLRQHLREFHTALRMKPKCSLCTKSCDTPEDLEVHEQLHSSQTPYACVLCPESFLTTIDLHGHVYNTHEELPLRCQEEGCGKGFETKMRLAYHMKLTHGPTEKPHQCPHCPFSSWTPSGLKNHLFSHTQEKTFKCEVKGCGRDFIWKSQLSSHVRREHGGPVTMIPCKTCGKEFTTAGLMKRHELNHSDLRPFPCHLCSARFKALKHLKRHLEGHDKGGNLKGEMWKPRKSRLVPTLSPPPQNSVPSFW